MISTLFINWDIPNGIEIGSFVLRFYSLMFLFSFWFGMRITKKIFETEGVDVKLVDKLFIYVFVGTLLGARLGHCIFYQWEDYKDNIIGIFLPVEFKPHFRFVGFSGLASHGAGVGILISLFLFAKKFLNGSFLWLVDRVVIVIALAGFFIRFGNLMNSEIIGLPTDMPWGFRFLKATYLEDPSMPRHPAQLYESIYYLFTFFALSYLYIKKNKGSQKGYLFGTALILIFVFRFFIEYIKEIQSGFESDMSLKMGQILSIPFILVGFYLLKYGKGKKSILEKTTKTIIALMICGFSLSCNSKVANSNSTKNDTKTSQKNFFKKQGTLDIYDKDGETKKTTLDIELANTPQKRAMGLMYRTALEDNQAMLFLMESEKIQRFWMKNTLIPLDIIFIDTKFNIVDIIHNAQPGDLDLRSSKKDAMYVLEIYGGNSKKLGIEEGQILKWELIK